jgi:ABC-type glycerol-3-phosphate transport system substrate-binding protein
VNHAGGFIKIPEERRVEMKRVIGLLCCALLILSSGVVYAQAKFGLQDIPQIKNKKDLNTIVETGQVWDKIMPYVAEFTKKTGVKVNVERVASPVVYSKENVELMAGTGYYDVTYVETAWTCEWSRYHYR